MLSVYDEETSTGWIRCRDTGDLLCAWCPHEEPAGATLGQLRRHRSECRNPAER